MTALATTVAVVVGVFLTVAGMFGIRAAWKVGQTGQTITNYREAASSWEATSTALKQEIAEIKTRHNDITHVLQEQLGSALETVTQLKIKIQVLEDVVTGRSVLTQMAADFSSQFRQLADSIAGKEGVETMGRELHADIDNLRQEVHALAARMK